MSIHPHQFNIQKIKPRARSHLKASMRRPGMAPNHLKLIRQLSCCKCGKHGPSDPHHLKKGTGERGMALRSTDKHTVPLCRHCHDEIERLGTRNEPEWFMPLAQALWASSCNLNRMKLVLAEHVV